MCVSALFWALAATNRNVTAKTTSATAPAVDGWYFRAVSGYPAAITFEPVVLFKNGDYFDIGDEPLELLDVQTTKAKRPKAWGTWKKQGEVFWLTGSDGKPHDYKLGGGNWFPAYPYSASLPLKKSYEKVSGGDYGNGVNALRIEKINFIDATHFTQGADAGISTPAAKAWGKSASGGTYKIYGNTIELTISDGNVIKKSFAMGASGSPAHPTNTMIFIGGDAYTDSD